MKLYAALGSALLHERGRYPRPMSFGPGRSRRRKPRQQRISATGAFGLSAYRIAVGDYRDGLQLAERFCVLANEQGDTAAWLIGGRMIGAALHYIGDQANARQHLDRMVTHYVAPPQRSHVTRFSVRSEQPRQGTLSNVLWLQGYPDQAVRMAAERRRWRPRPSIMSCPCAACWYTRSAPSRCTSATWPRPNTSWRCFKSSGETYTTVWNALARCLRGMLLIERGDIAGLPLLRSALGELREIRFVTRYPAYLGVLAQALGAHGHAVEARNVIDEAVTWAAAHEERWCMPELFRIKAELLQRDSAGLSRPRNTTCGTRRRRRTASSVVGTPCCHWPGRAMAPARQIRRSERAALLHL